MPVFIGDVLESCGGPILDLSTKQVKGLGVFDSVSDRNDLSSAMRSTGYLSVVGSASPQISVHTGGDWTSSDNWDSVLKDVGHAIKLDNYINGVPGTVEGFLIGEGTASFLRRGDVFHIFGLHKINDGVSTDVNDGSYLVIDDPWSYGGSPNTGPSKSNDPGSVISALKDYINNGTIRKFSDTKPLITSLPSPSSLTLGSDVTLTQALLSNTNPVQIPISIITTEGRRDSKLNINQFIAMLGAGIADGYVDAGYGSITSYGGTAGVESSGGDLDGDGYIGVGDILTLLSNFGLESETETNWTDTTVSIPQSLGSTTTQPASSVGNFWKGATDRYYIYRNWGSGSALLTNTLPYPSITSGAASVTIFNVSDAPTYSSTQSSLTLNSATLGDPIVFAGEESTGFEINAFPGSPSKLILKEGALSDNNYSSNIPILQEGFRNFVTVDSSQASDFNSGSLFQVFLRIKKYSQEPESISDLTSNVMSTRVVVVGSDAFSNLGVPDAGGEAFFNFNTLPVAPQYEETETDISELYYQQHGYGIFETEDTPCVAISVEMGFMVTNVSSNVNRTLAGNFTYENGNFTDIYNSVITQNNKLVLVPHP